MAAERSGKVFLGIGGIFVLLVGVIFALIWFGGKAYQGLTTVGEQTTTEYTLKNAKKIKKITAKRRGEESCIEITPDGVVRQYAVCGGELSDVDRLQDPKNILKLFKLLSETDLQNYTEGDGELYELTIETDTGTQTIYVIINNQTPGGINNIINTIIDIEENIPPPDPTPQSSPGGGVFSSPSPVPSGVGGGGNPSPQPSGTPGASTQPFACDFSEGGQKKPANISNIICSTEPSPVP